VPVPSYLIDSNILVRWLQPRDADFPVIEASLLYLIEQQADLCYTSQNVAEFWNACTRPIDRNGFGLTPEEANRRASLFETRLRLLPDSPTLHWKWRRMLLDYRISGIQVHDTRLVAAMLVHGVRRILTLNAKDFLRFDQVQAVHPKDVRKS